jgi:hypothetical protein
VQELATRYPIAIEIGSKTAAYGLVVPDLPGCFSAGDTVDEAVTAAEEAAAACRAGCCFAWTRRPGLLVRPVPALLRS